MPIEITPALLAELREKAEAATPGPWGVRIITAKNNMDGCVRTHSWIYHRSGDNLTYQDDDGVKNNQHIAAANPAVVLALVAEIERLQVKLVCSERYAAGLSQGHAVLIAEKNAEIERLRNKLSI